jgi:aspartyl-tRNA(Asn)/glutamyl-tRNA(Gln) amidotransferase subunit C
MPISLEEVRHVAALARIELTTEEEAELVVHISTVLAYIEKLNTLNTDAIEPTSHAVDVPAPLREDQVTTRSETAALLQNAPARTADFFSVPKILE